MTMYKIEVLIDAPNEEAADLARDEIINGCQDAEDSGDVPRGTFYCGELEVVK